MPEGDTIHHAALRLRGVLLGGPLDRVRTPHPRTRPRGWETRLAGRTVTAVEARGKHLLISFDDESVIHSHLRMTGQWSVRETAGRAPARGRSLRRAWLVLGRGAYDAVEFDGPLLDLRTATQVARDPRLRALGPDICVAEAFDADEVVRRIRGGDPNAPVAEALLQQRYVAGIGNVWKSEGCHAAGIDPARPLGRTDDDELRAILAAIAPGIQRCAREGTRLRPKEVYGRSGRPCPRCGRLIAQRGLGDDNRTTYWCPGCQR